MPVEIGTGVGTRNHVLDMCPDPQMLRGSATGRALDFAISRSRVQILLGAMLRNNLGQVVYIYMPLSPSSITWYRPKGGDALRLRR